MSYICIRLKSKYNPQKIKKNLFETPFAHALLVFESQEPIGLALYFFNYSTWTGRPGLYVRDTLLISFAPYYTQKCFNAHHGLISTSIKLEDLFVSEKRRGKGVAKALFRELGKIAQDKVCHMPISSTPHR
jgi:GNAT superfamily N-acetyltransferase